MSVCVLHALGVQNMSQLSIECSVVYVVSYFPDLDKVSCTNELTKTIPATRILLTILFVTLFRNENNQAVLYHCQIDNERRTFLKGKWDYLGLCEYSLYDCFTTPMAWVSAVFNDYSRIVALSGISDVHQSYRHVTGVPDNCHIHRNPLFERKDTIAKSYILTDPSDQNTVVIQ